MKAYEIDSESPAIYPLVRARQDTDATRFVFVTCSHSEVPFVDHLVDHLLAEGFIVTLSDDVTDRRTAIEDADAALIILAGPMTEQLAHEIWLLRECRARFLPVLLDGVTLPIELGDCLAVLLNESDIAPRGSLTECACRALVAMFGE